MPTTTSRLDLVQPIGTDAPSEYRVSITSNATALDDAAMWSSGTLASRPGSNAVPVGTLYFATDTAVLYLNQTGSAWEVIQSGVDTGWTALSIPTGFTTVSGYRTPSYRTVGNIVRLDGAFQSTTGFTATATFTGLPEPAHSMSLPSSGTNFGGVTIGVTGHMVTNSEEPFGANGQTLSLSGLFYPLD